MRISLADITNINIEEGVYKYTPMVKRIAQHLMGKLPPSVQVDDLVQAGMMGLLEAMKNFDQEKGASFETYATIRIRGAMLDEIRRSDWTPRSVHRNTRRMIEATRQLENEINREATHSEVAARLGIPLEDFYDLLKDTHGAKLFAWEDMTLGLDCFAPLSPPSAEPSAEAEFEDFRKILIKSLSTLPERERMVINLYYDEELNLRQVGEILGVSESRASQIHAQAMLKLQTRFKSWPF